MNNRILINQKLNELSKKTGYTYTLGCYNLQIERLSKEELNKVLDKIDNDWTDIHIIINKKKYVVEIKTVDDEKDFDMLTLAEYNSRYKNSEYKD